MPKGKRPPAPKDETKADKFKRLARPRYERVVNQIRSLGKLGTGAYERSEDQVIRMKEVLHKEIDAMADRLKPGRKVSNRPDVPDVL